MFRKEYCMPKEWGFSWKIFDREVSTQKFLIVATDIFNRKEYKQKNSRARWS